MEVILKENVPNLGFVGDIVKVRPGYYRNFLLPGKKATMASSQNIKLFEHQKRILEVKKSQKKDEANALVKKLAGLVVTVNHAAAEGDKIFGSVTVTEIHEGLKQIGFDIDRHLILLAAPIRTLGEHVVSVKLHQDVSVEIKVVVAKKE
jgi:large subunit ribosomal protein L9